MPIGGGGDHSPSLRSDQMIPNQRSKRFKRESSPFFFDSSRTNAPIPFFSFVERVWEENRAEDRVPVVSSIVCSIPERPWLSFMVRRRARPRISLNVLPNKQSDTEYRPLCAIQRNVIWSVRRFSDRFHCLSSLSTSGGITTIGNDRQSSGCVLSGHVR